MGFQGKKPPKTLGIRPDRDGDMRCTGILADWPKHKGLTPAQRAVCVKTAQDAYERVAHESLAIEYEIDEQKRVIRAEIVRLASQIEVKISAGIVGHPRAVGDDAGKAVLDVVNSTQDCLQFSFCHGVTDAHRIEFTKKPIDGEKALELLRKGIFK
jgi:hypothetical protein